MNQEPTGEATEMELAHESGEKRERGPNRRLSTLNSGVVCHQPRKGHTADSDRHYHYQEAERATDRCGTAPASGLADIPTSQLHVGSS